MACQLLLNVRQLISQLHAGIEKEHAAHALHRIPDHTRFPCVGFEVPDMRGEAVERKLNDLCVLQQASRGCMLGQKPEIVNQDALSGRIGMQTADQIQELVEIGGRGSSDHRLKSAIVLP